MKRMDCGEARELLNALDDGELPEGERAAVLEHVAHCVGCSSALGELQALRRRVRAAGTFSLPAGVEASVRGAVGLESRRYAGRRWLPYLAAPSHVAVALLAALIGYWVAARADARDMAAREVVAAHVRSLMDERLIQVASSDSHTVRPWFAGKVPFSPEVVDLAPQGFPLIGGRVDYVLDHRAAVLVYERHKHRINVFILPADQVATDAFQAARSGYNVLAWRKAGFAYFAASDLNAGEMQELAVALAAAGQR